MKEEYVLDYKFSADSPYLDPDASLARYELMVWIENIIQSGANFLRNFRAHFNMEEGFNINVKFTLAHTETPFMARLGEGRTIPVLDFITS